MILIESQIRPLIEEAKAAFPRLKDWQYNNEINENYFGFSLWGELILDPEEIMSRSYFVTFYTDKDQWSGTLTIGKPSYLWSSADVGDAHLVSTDDCDSLIEAISALKQEIKRLFTTLITD